jgi:hypothetical protein
MVGATRGAGASDLNGRFTAAKLAWSLVEIGHEESLRSAHSVVAERQVLDVQQPSPSIGMADDFESFAACCRGIK